MSTDGTLQRIDDALDDYDTWSGHSADAARWAGGPDEGEWPERAYVDELQELQQRAIFAAWGCFPQRVIVGIDPAGQHVHFTSPEPPTVRARLDAIEEMTQAYGLTINEWQRAVQCWKCRYWHYGEGMRCDSCWPKQLLRPMAAAERTRSPRWRAGSRRAKRQARRST